MQIFATSGFYYLAVKIQSLSVNRVRMLRLLSLYFQSKLFKIILHWPLFQQQDFTVKVLVTSIFVQSHPVLLTVSL